MCNLCERIESIKNGTNPYFIKEMETGYAVLGDHQYFKGYSLLLCKIHASELHELEKPFRLKFLEEMSQVAEAVWKVYQPQKLNYELLGNTIQHMHWHITPRYKNDPMPTQPLWLIDRNIRYNEIYKPNLKILQTLTQQMRAVL